MHQRERPKGNLFEVLDFRTMHSARADMPQLSSFDNHNVGLGYPCFISVLIAPLHSSHQTMRMIRSIQQLTSKCVSYPSNTGNSSS